MRIEVPQLPLEVAFDSSVFSLDTIKRALYRVSDKAIPDVTIDGSRIVCSLQFDEATSSKAREQFGAILRREVLDQDLRQKIAQESAGFRELILGYVFSKTGLQDDGKIS